MNNKILKLRKLLDMKKSDCGNCHDCCGCIIYTTDEQKAISKYLLKKGITPPNGKGYHLCEFLDCSGKCVVYEERPIICRMFGIVNHVSCKCPKLLDSKNLISHTNEMIQYSKQAKKDFATNSNFESILEEFNKNFGH